jgi:hypothetical protein
MNEYKISLHIHTTYSDGNANHSELLEIAKKAGLNAIITTDHNIWVEGLDGFYGDGKEKLMLLVGEEVHDRTLDPPGNHMLVIGQKKELSPYSQDPQRLIDQVNAGNGLSFLAHPIEDPLARFHEKAFSWRNWEVKNFTGIELWNQLSEFKSVSQDLKSAFINALFPKRMSLGPLERCLALWVDLISTRNRPIVAVGGVDAHQLEKKIGPFTLKLYPYLHHFKSIRTHILTPEPLSNNFLEARKQIFSALRQGHCFIGYDLPAATDGFRFSVHNDEGQFTMGDEVKVTGGSTFQIKLPEKNLCRLFKDGKLINEWSDREVCTHISTEHGVYRVEAYIPYKGKLRGWIFSNPIYAWL